MSKAWAKGSTRRWRNTRRRILLRDRGLCQLAIAGVCTKVATQVHHVLGKGVSEADQHLLSSCRECNARVGQPGRGKVEHKRVSRW